MKKYEYKFVEIPIKRGLSVSEGDAFAECQKIILSEASHGWRLKQVVLPPSEKSLMYAPLKYQIIFEREL